MRSSNNGGVPFARSDGGTTVSSRWRLIAAAAAVLAMLAGGRVSAQMIPGPDSDAPNAPAVRITNGLVTAILYLPDPERGYYRATRFDWSGAVADLRAGGHSYFGRWFPEYDPRRHDAITGPVQEDVTGQGFDAAGPVRGDAVQVNGNRIDYLKPVETSVRMQIRGFSASAADYDIRVENRRTGAGARVTSDRPLSDMVFWSSPRTTCPEAYIHVHAERGRPMDWTTTYDFYSLPGQR